MAYTKTIWLNNNPSTPLDEVNLNKIETGIEEAHLTADSAKGDIVTINTTLSGYGSRLDSIDGVGGTVESLTNSVISLSGDSNDLEKYNEWRNIEVDPAGDVIADLVDNIFISWAGAVSVLLPTTPELNSRIRVCDAGCDFSVNNLTIKRNTNNMMGATNDYVFDYANGSIELSWSGAVYGWVVTRSV